MTIKTRFAPSPTGHLHVGNIRTALHNWMFAKKEGGTFLLRLDDTDAERSKEEYVEAIRADLAWLGLTADEEQRQSARFDRYEEQLEKLKAAGRVYPAYETAQELDLKRKIQLGRGKPPIYDRAAMDLTAEQISAFEAEGRKPHWRFQLDHATPITWTDRIRGDQHFDPALLSDPVIRREDGSWLYMLPSAIDDIDMGITHVVRGEDHVANTAVQIQMFHALGAEPPEFAHEALLVGTEGKLSKRLGSLGVSSFREKHIEPQAIVALLARIGTSDPVEPVTEVEPLIATFDFARFGRAPARFDEEELAQLNQKIVHLLEYQDVKSRLPDGMDAAAWDVIRPNLHDMHDVDQWWQVVTGPVSVPDMPAEDREFLAIAHKTLEELEASDDLWKDLTGALKEATGRKGKPLFMPLRQALTGLDHGPDMNALLPLIGKEAALARLATASA
ncbi:MAG: glutamate--tRNA ligase [Sphingomonadales bacterium]|nr:glutamate--tRNA ligase [Sphingomonadales bacterium]PIX66436.1 MAG: glutamate--tRNA ligase [Sphingomonadales bacterium CG_4_10_14_3_um_filter_58_15]NCO50009.1 glutamate--tRNA ligase [Sphingomonadales bacterium]NCP00472.1 glutamate--tRNA ligase [Sphingomonadales bacterium]NCP26710.1 glutamate--tRNA ligase [Sphingomonadales bacterium]